MNSVWSTLVFLLMTLWCCHLSSTDKGLNLIHARLINMLRFRQRYLMFRRDRRNLDLRFGKLFSSNPDLECCPTKVAYVARQRAISKHGIVVELLATQNFTQQFYESLCLPAFKDRPCQFLDRRYKRNSRCIQQFTYMYALIRSLNGPPNESYRFDLVRIPSGCKCKLIQGAVDTAVENKYGSHLNMVY